MLDIVKGVGKALGFAISDNMIDFSYRLGKGQDNAFPGIMVGFVRRLDREEFLRKRKVEKRKLNLQDINMLGTTPIFVNESLSPGQGQVLAAARAVKREKGYKFLWVKHGKIFLRKDENSPVIVITDQEDLLFLL